MNSARSDFGTLPAPPPFVRKTAHADPSLTIVENQSAGGADTTTARGKVLTRKVQIATALGDPEITIALVRQ